MQSERKMHTLQLSRGVHSTCQVRDRKFHTNTFLCFKWLSEQSLVPEGCQVSGANALLHSLVVGKYTTSFNVL